MKTKHLILTLSLLIPSACAPVSTTLDASTELAEATATPVSTAELAEAPTITPTPTPAYPPLPDDVFNSLPADFTWEQTATGGQLLDASGRVLWTVLVDAAGQEQWLKAMPENPVSGDWYSTWNETEQRVVKYVYYEIPEKFRWSLVTPAEGWVEVSSNLLMGLDGEPIPTGLYSQDEMQAMVDAGQIDPKIVEFAQTKDGYQMDYYVGAVVVGFDDQNGIYYLVFNKDGYGYLSRIVETLPDVLSVVEMGQDGRIDAQFRQGFMLAWHAKFTDESQTTIEVGGQVEGNPTISIGDQILVSIEVAGEINNPRWNIAINPKSGELVLELEKGQRGKDLNSIGRPQVLSFSSSIVVPED